VIDAELNSVFWEYSQLVFLFGVAVGLVIHQIIFHIELHLSDRRKKKHSDQKWENNE
jgi:hypothetical protein